MTLFWKTKFGGLFAPQKEPVQIIPQVPADTRIYCIGDIHGRDDLLAVMHSLIRHDAEGYTGRKVVIYLGDYIDRGLNSKNVIEQLLHHPLPTFEQVFLRGNHEQFLQLFLQVPETAIDWIKFGGHATLYSYGVKLQGMPYRKSQLQEIHRQLQELLPEAHKRFYEDLHLTHCEGDYFFVHAGIRPGIALQRQKEEDLLWIRDVFTGSSRKHEKVIVHGHTISEEPEILPNRIGIDTGAYFSGILTCLVLESVERRFITARLEA